MTIESTGYHHIELRDGVPWVKGTQVKVHEIAEDRVDAGWGAEVIQDNDPTLALAQIYSALAYYYDHREEVDAYIARGRLEDQRLRAELEDRGPASRARAMKQRA